jgi:long-chain acyl-CoA synthetase
MNKGIDISVKQGKQIVKGLGYYKPRIVRDLRELVKGSAKSYGNAMAFKFKDSQGKITGKTYIEFDRDIDRLGTALLSLGLESAHISIIGENRYEWGVCYLSIMNGTGVVVPLDKHLPINEVENLLSRGKVEAVFYSPAYQNMMLEIASTNKSVKYYICMESLTASHSGDARFLELPGLLEKGRRLLDSGDDSFTGAYIDRDKMSALLFTSGTTSMSKGVMLSHSNVASNVSSVTATIKAGPGDVHLSLLPLHHTFENTVGLLFMVHSGVCIAYSDGIKHVVKNLKEYKVTLLVAVPALFEVMYRRLQSGIEKSGKAKLVATLVKVSEALRFVGIDLRKKLFKSIFEQFGPDLRLAVSGAAALDPEVIIGFDKIGLRLLQGYGLTEASPIVAVNNDFVNKPGTIGYPIAGVEVAIDSPDEDGIGEIIARGNNIMLGYYEDDGATAEVIDAEGWLKTGDLGIIDEQGFIKITGREKSMIVLSNGKKAFPEEYEVQINNITGVKDSFVWGNEAAVGDIQVCAKLIVDKEALMLGKGYEPSEEEISEMFDAAIRNINKSMPQYKMVRYFIMSYDDLIKTTTLKTKRPLEYERVRMALEKSGLDMRKASGKFIQDA